MPAGRSTYEQALQQGHNHAWDGRWAEAAAAYRRALAERPDDVLALSCLGQACLSLGRHQEALDCYQAAQRQAPNDPALLDKVAELLAALGRTPEAVATALTLAEQYLARGDRPSAIATWRRVITWQPDHAEARRRLSEVYAAGGSRRDMDAAVQEALALARVYRGRGELQQAIQECERALTMDPAHVEGRALLEDLRLEALEAGIFSVSAVTRRGNPINQAVQDALSRLAEQVFEQSAVAETRLDLRALETRGTADQAQLRLSPQQLNALIGQAIDFQSRDMVEEAIARYEEARRHGASQPEVALNLGVLYLRQSRWEPAIAALNQALVEPAYALACHFALGQAHQAQGTLDLALRHFVEALKIVDLRTVDEATGRQIAPLYDGLAESYATHIAPDEAAAFCNSLTDFLTSEDWEERIIDARQRANALAVGGQIGTLAEFFAVPSYQVVMEAIALSQEYLARGYLRAAMDQCYRVIEHAPGYLPIHRRLAEILVRQGRLSEAVEKYDMLARTYEARHEPAQAIQVYQDVLALVPDDLTVRAHLTSLLQQEGRYEEAIQQYLDTAAVHLRLLQVDEAVGLYAQALKLAPRTADARGWGVRLYRAIAEAYASRVDWNRAIAALLQAKKLAPDNEEVRRQLGELYLKQGRPDLARAELAELESAPAPIPSREELWADETLERLRVMIRRRPDDLAARQALAQAYAARGLRQEAVAELDKLGELQLDQGLFQEAQQTIEAIIALEPPNVDAYRQLLAQLRQQ